jgi:hypothetical protein
MSMAVRFHESERVDFANAKIDSHATHVRHSDSIPPSDHTRDILDRDTKSQLRSVHSNTPHPTPPHHAVPVLWTLQRSCLKA